MTVGGVPITALARSPGIAGQRRLSIVSTREGPGGLEIRQGPN